MRSRPPGPLRGAQKLLVVVLPAVGDVTGVSLPLAHAAEASSSAAGPKTSFWVRATPARPERGVSGPAAYR